MITGTVKWFSESKGIGYVIPDSGGSDLLAHFSAIADTGNKNLWQGQRVSFDMTTTRKGNQMSNIRSLD